MTNFSTIEIGRVWNTVQDYVLINWSVGRGCKSKFYGPDVCFMLLMSLKNRGKREYMGGMFRIKGVVFQRFMDSFLLVFSTLVYERQATDPAGILAMKVLPNKRKQFKHHPYALYAIDVTF